ncbi:MAG: hypothetical protein AL399_02150 [Candidatus [Bacteroides] periocalifornicus]|jgi:hypothetical protein|uniref:Uncharacterized protein n=1 Tax=Candidatus [Bacteroides] periocalifornicus TaxID=1702214 RepID=A0A0Q4BAJ8_9BACT|nr:MAG: hypothetical protein AL399_02150 [Candidatus [Bacteroides] periocalifornicus]
MAFIRFVHTPKPRQFNYKPRYYDPKREHLDMLKRSIQPDSFATENLSAEQRKAQLRASTRYRVEQAFQSARGKHRLSTRKTIARRTLVLFALLMLAIFLYLKF